jgi:hypothetical protein
MPFVPLACDGCWSGWQAVFGLAIAVIVLIGSIYMLLASNLGARVGYLVLMTALFAWLLLLSAMWLVGVPGTTPGTGPRGPEPQWIPFTPTSAQAGDFKPALDTFPEGTGWKKIGTVFPGRIDSKGEFETIRSLVEDSESRLAKKQGLAATDPADWAFRASGVAAATPDEESLPQARVAYFQDGQTLLFGATIPSTSKHPEVTVFAYRDKGKVFLYALYFVIVSLLGFALHLWFLARHEAKQKEAEKEAEPAVPVSV